MAAPVLAAGSRVHGKNLATARAFTAELTGRRNRLRTLVQRVAEELEAEVRTIPEKVDRSPIAR
jgi:hypothetical protein